MRWRPKQLRSDAAVVFPVVEIVFPVVEVVFPVVKVVFPVGFDEFCRNFFGG